MKSSYDIGAQLKKFPGCKPRQDASRKFTIEAAPHLFTHKDTHTCRTVKYLTSTKDNHNILVKLFLLNKHENPTIIGQTGSNVKSLKLENKSQSKNERVKKKKRKYWAT